MNCNKFCLLERVTAWETVITQKGLQPGKRNYSERVTAWETVITQKFKILEQNKINSDLICWLPF